MAHEILETAWSPNSSFPFLLDFGLGLGLGLLNFEAFDFKIFKSFFYLVQCNVIIQNRAPYLIVSFINSCVASMSFVRGLFDQVCE